VKIAIETIQEKKTYTNFFLENKGLKLEVSMTLLYICRWQWAKWGL